MRSTKTRGVNAESYFSLVLFACMPLITGHRKGAVGGQSASVVSELNEISDQLGTPFPIGNSMARPNTGRAFVFCNAALDVIFRGSLALITDHFQVSHTNVARFRGLFLLRSP